MCGLFKWCEDQQLRAGALLHASPQYQSDFMLRSQNSSKKSSSACFKCGQEKVKKMWTRKSLIKRLCPNQPSDPCPDKGDRALTLTSSPDACFKCGK
jgi:hypothetical protein